jgi:pyruvate,water dikinase
MISLIKRIKKHFTGSPKASVEELRNIFRKKYHAFKLLLAANDAILHLMTEMEAALYGNYSFGMTFIRSHCTAICVSTFSAIRYLNELADNKYKKLELVLSDIQEKINAILLLSHTLPLQDMVLPLSEVNKELADGVGAKMANLGEIINRVEGINIPPGFVMTAAAYDLFLTHNQLQDEINRRIQALEMDELSDLYRHSSEIQMLIINSELPPALADAIAGAYLELESLHGPGLRVSLRSSAIGEDMVNTSFAGQYRSELNVSYENLLTVYKEILASKYALTAVTYRLHKGLRDEDVPMCVGCMKMIDAVAGGVMYSRDPTNIRSDAIFINAVHGLAKTVVDGSITPDLWVVSRTEPLSIIKEEIADKKQKIISLPEEGICVEVLDEEGQTAALTDSQVLELARIALILEDHFLTPQDIEWSIDDQGQIFILQSRPLKQLDLKHRDESLLPTNIDNPMILRGGDMAAPGIAAGPAYLVSTNLDLLRFPEGAVLITSFPHPSWAPLLSRAAALVTDRGGITGHLANVAREFGIPALFNTTDATKKIVPEMIITVDAEGKSIYEGRVESLLSLSTQKTGLMMGTPVFETLKEVMTYIAPLNLTNPDSPDFKIRSCRTLHDITRYVHEVSVKEMFDYEKNKELSKHFIKRLVCEVPLQWWVLDLEDGFKEDVSGKEVNIANIASIPMLALWEGITTVPWEGPPPVDTKGFMSIISQATTNPNLNTVGPSVFGNQNYFMVSKNFCNLSSRFGFHFSTVEALIGDNPHENYMRFAFKGGAADYQRRVARAKLVGEILEKYDFKVDIKEDSIFARLEGEAKDYMLERLRILGYISVHTRQLDMIMLNAEQASHYYYKIINDLENYILPLSSKPYYGV